MKNTSLFLLVCCAVFCSAIRVSAQYQWGEYQSTTPSFNSIELYNQYNKSGTAYPNSSSISLELNQRYKKNQALLNNSISYWNFLLNYELKSYEKVEFERYGKLIDEISERGDYENLTQAITSTYDYLFYLFDKYKLVYSQSTCNSVINLIQSYGKWIVGYTYTGAKFDTIHFYSFENRIYAVVHFVFFQDNLKLAKNMNYVFGPLTSDVLDAFKYISVGESENDRFDRLISRNRCNCE